MKYSRWRNFMDGFDRNLTHSLFELRSILPTTKMPISTIALLRPNATVTLRDGYCRVTLALHYDETWSQALAFVNSIGTTVKGTGSAQNPDWSPKLDLSLLLQKGRAYQLLRNRSRVRNSTSDSCDVTVSIGAD